MSWQEDKIGTFLFRSNQENLYKINDMFFCSFVSVSFSIQSRLHAKFLIKTPVLFSSSMVLFTIGISAGQVSFYVARSCDHGSSLNFWMEKPERAFMTRNSEFSRNQMPSLTLSAWEKVEFIMLQHTLIINEIEKLLVIVRIIKQQS